MITVEGEGEHIVMTPDDVVDNTDFMRLRDYEFVIYFPNRNEKVLETDVFSRTLSDAEQPAETIVSILMGGRRSDGSINHIVSDSTLFLGLEIRNRVCYLNFNEGFFQCRDQKRRRGELEALCVCQLAVRAFLYRPGAVFN